MCQNSEELRTYGDQVIETDLIEGEARDEGLRSVEEIVQAHEQHRV